MNWTRIAMAGVAAGVATWLVDFVQHGVIMAPTYKSLGSLFAVTANPAWFLVVAITICFMAALLFARTRGSWAAGWKGGATFGFFLGLVVFFQSFYAPLMLDGYPYYLAWCEGGMSMIDSVVAGAVIGALVKA